MTIAKRQAWFDKGKLDPDFRKGTSGALVAKGFENDGAHGFHGFTADWSEDAVPSYDVTADFEAVLIMKVKDCSACTNIAVAKKRPDGKFELVQAAPKDGTMDGPLLGDQHEFHHEVFITSVDNLMASQDPTKQGKSVTNGKYTIIEDNLE